MTRRQWTTLIFATLALIGAVALRLLAEGHWRFAWPASPALAELREQRVLIGIVVGAALAVGGVLLQCLLRNSLASPDLLGLASGAGLGVTVAAYFVTRDAQVAPAAPSPAAALIASLAVLGLVYLFSQRRGLIEPVSLILVGVIVAIMCSAATLFVQRLLTDRGETIARWLLGVLRDDVDRRELAIVGAVTFAVILASLVLARAMDAASLGDDEARSVGVPLGPLRAFLFLGAGVLTAGAVVLAGPIGFVGLVCPHLIRLGAGPSHRTLVIGSALSGAALVVLADALVRSIYMDSGRLPIGVLTSVIGGPLFIVMLRRQGAGRGAL